MRLSLGSIVLYEAACRQGDLSTARGSVLLGIIVDDLGPVTGVQYKVGSVTGVQHQKSELRW